MQPNIDYIVREGTHEQWENWFNQWRNTHTIEIAGSAMRITENYNPQKNSYNDQCKITMVVKRTVRK